MNSSKYSRLLTAGGVAVFVGCVAIARIGAQDPGNPFHDHGDVGELIHVLPAPAALHNHNPRFSEPTFASESGASVFPGGGSGNLIDHNGSEIPNARFVQIYWNATVANSTATPNGSTLQSYIGGFADVYSDGLPYSSSSLTGDYTIITQYGSSNPIANALPNGGRVVDSQGTSSRITDSGIQSYLKGVFNRGLVAADPNTVYGVYFPHGMRISLQGGSSCTSFCGYHSHFTYNGTLIKYAVFPYTDCYGCSLSGLTVADILTIVTSHEIRESVTDSLGTAWYDAAGYEADDKCAWQNLYRTTSGGYWVQPEFSNGGTKNGTSYPGPGCVVPR